MLRLSYDDNPGMRVCLAPLLIRLVMDQESYNFVERWKEVGDKMLRKLDAPRHVLEISKPFTPRSNVVTGNPRIMNGGDHVELIIELELLFDPGDCLPDQEGGTFRFGSEEEAELVLAASYSAWVETPGAIEFIKARRSSGEWKLMPGVPQQ
ncbi:hypothetical protein PHISP_04392 [Aspergillus sp. HF37]|nr:hypothetical protein PHISP_04392 [Aspergillus sp. HF37]